MSIRANRPAQRPQHGGLGTPEGKLAVRWSVLDGKMSIHWSESSGPAITESGHYGFGMRLFSRALAQFDGTIRTDFEPTGLNCEMTLMLVKSPNRHQLLSRWLRSNCRKLALSQCPRKIRDCRYRAT
jgi:hypothetical protein